MYLAAAPWAKYTDGETGETVASNNPIVDDHLVYAIVLVVLMLFTAERTWGLGKWWQSTSIVQRFPWLA
jgi:thiosulfate dehydrogenase (quinone) large subunit